MKETEDHEFDRTAKRRSPRKVVRSWQLQEAKAKLSQLVRLARAEGPQLITRQGKGEVVVLPVEQYEAILASSRRPQSVVQFFAKSPLVGVELNLTRDRDMGREIEL